jgi:3-methyl-2-oxobutanoate hydroxymethyltransferase
MSLAESAPNQSALSGFRVQGKTAESALQVTKDALALQEAGAFAILIEALPARVAAAVQADLRIPTIGQSVLCFVLSRPSKLT